MSRTPPVATDRHVWLSCEPADSDAGSLLSGLSTALGLDGQPTLDDITAEIWSWAPERVCVVLDDVHEIEAGSTGAWAMAQLVADLPGNGHVVLSSRVDPPFPLATLAARRQLLRIVETDLLFDELELREFAERRRVPIAVLGSCGGWPAIAELAAAAGEDLLFEFLWEEVLARLGPRRARQLGRVVLTGGGDDLAVAALESDVSSAADLFAGVPLAVRSADGWFTLHPLWQPTLRRLLSPDELVDAQHLAAVARRDRQRFEDALGLFLEAEEWDEAVATIRRAALDPIARLDAQRLGRWARSLPEPFVGDPVASLARGIELAAAFPADALPVLARAVDGLRAAGDVDGEVAAIYEQGLVMWWSNDITGLLSLHRRARELGDEGSVNASHLADIGDAAVAHVLGDSAGVFQALADIDATSTGRWAGTVGWLRHVAHRRQGDLDRAEFTLNTMTGRDDLADPQLRAARTRTNWLRGRTHVVVPELSELEALARTAGHRYLHVEIALELAARRAWLGDVIGARAGPRRNGLRNRRRPRIPRADPAPVGRSGARARPGRRGGRRRHPHRRRPRPTRSPGQLVLARPGRHRVAARPGARRQAGLGSRHLGAGPSRRTGSRVGVGGGPRRRSHRRRSVALARRRHSARQLAAAMGRRAGALRPADRQPAPFGARQHCPADELGDAPRAWRTDRRNRQRR